MAIIECSDLHKSYEKLRVLRGIDFRMEAGEGVVLLGANGCGKSTLMRCISGLERPQQGGVRVLGTDLAQAGRRSLREARTRIGMVFQKFNLVQNLSVFQNVLYGASGRHRSFWSVTAPFAAAEERDYAMHCLERVNLADRAGQRADQLSGGQQQRVAIARTLMQQPTVVLADEPVASLDPRSAREVMELLWGIVREERLSLLCCLHQLDFAEEFGERALGMKAGRIVLDRPMADIRRAELDALYEGAVRVDEAETKPRLAVAS
ncbi:MULTISPECIES: phosphonate ABC transporter ATP-binding protein [Halorhodospira]|uniref:phosphonate ABC transporter ATP-binding protein n=1 Tax=Halorhodospira TaxID=85108 RepID=UPI00191384C9|nr:MULTISPECIES: phosphonate ABC transporter ATP-binding protein [Halorhodospira]MBK5935543.1 phosphonate ABC transporter ATP-binding protein [Halorhodospira halophila]MCG5537626.1 phosphonate ABC transporter ATP-binding protein [Halorhodospira sp. 9622]